MPAPTTTTSALAGGSVGRPSGAEVSHRRGGHYDRRVALPLRPPIKPQLALSRKAIPDEEGWAYEPKYDGFRAIAFVDGDDLFLQSRTGRPLARYFPELEFPSGRYVIDGELLILGDDGAEIFDALQNRLHPAESRVKMLAETTPAIFRAFDLLAVGDESALESPFSRAPRGAREAPLRVRATPGPSS